MQINNFNYRYTLLVNGKNTNLFFTSRKDARTMKTTMRSTPKYNNSDITIMRQQATWGKLTPTS
jgi:hypothetical protein